MRSLLLFISVTLLFNLSLTAQRGGPHIGKMYDTGKDKVDKGWYFGLGATYMWPYLKNENSVDYDTLGNSYTQKYTAQPKGRPGLYGEIGLFRMNKRKVINFVDYGLAYKWFRGKEDFTSELFINNSLYSTTETYGTFSDHLISGHLNLGHRFDKNHKLFYLNGLGLNLDYHLITKREGGGIIAGSPHQFPNSILGEMHYFFGMGFRVNDKFIVMPMVETPVFAIYPFNHIVSTHDYFNTRFRPIIVKVRFMFLKNKSTTCPPVYNPAGLGPEK